MRIHVLYQWRAKHRIGRASNGPQWKCLQIKWTHTHTHTICQCDYNDTDEIGRNMSEPAKAIRPTLPMKVAALKAQSKQIGRIRSMRTNSHEIIGNLLNSARRPIDTITPATKVRNRTTKPFKRATCQSELPYFRRYR